jgi:adenylate cyclase
MPANPNKLSRFWQELKRRRVIHVITVYASAAFVIIELINNLAEPLNLPPNLLTIVVIVLAVGFPLAIVLSWLYDLTGRGIEKTKPQQELKEGEKVPVPNAWRIATIISFVLIIGLVTINIVMGSRGLRPGDIESLVILPFDNFTGDDQLDWVAAAMHSSLIGDMGIVSGLRVLGETTSNAYKKTDLTATEIAKKDNVDALVEPTLTCYGDMVCLQVKVITPYPEEKVLWVGDFMEDKSQILNLYKRIISKVAGELKVNLTLQEETLLADSRIVDPDAYDAYLKGMAYVEKFSPEAWSVAIESFEKAIEIEPDWAAPYEGLSRVGNFMNQAGIGSESDRLRMIYENLNKALELDPNSAEAHSGTAGVAAWIEFDWKKAEKEFLKAIELNPSQARSHSFYAHVLTILRRTDEALYHGKLSVELNPEDAFTLGLYAVVLRHAGQCQEALFYLEKALSLDPDHPFLQRGNLHSLYRCLGDYEIVFKDWKEGNYDRWEMMGGDVELLEEIFYEHGWIAFNQELTKLHEEAVAKGIQVSNGFFYTSYLTIGEYDKAMDYLEIIYEANHNNPNLPYLSAKDTYDKMKGNPRYLEFLKKMNLPIN